MALTRRSAAWLASGAVMAVLVVVALLPVTTRQGVDFTVATHDLPLYLKVLDFVDRDLNYRQLARRITATETTDTSRALALMAWTRANIRDLPPGWPVVDDHVWSIVVRGYGIDEQKTDVFATLATYAGVPAYWIQVEVPPVRLPIALVRADGRWRVLDVGNGLAFWNARRELATVDEIATDAGLVRATAGDRVHRGRSYVEVFAGFKPPTPPGTLRAEKQMPWPRVVYEAKRLVGWTVSEPETASVTLSR
jgi:hypothetical protein